MCIRDRGMVVTGKLSDGTMRNIPLSDKALKFTGFDSNKRAVQTITVTYGVAKTTYDVTAVSYTHLDVYKRQG